VLRTSRSFRPETQLLRSVHGRAAGPLKGLVGWTEEVESSDLILLSKLQDTIKGEKMRTCLPDLGPCGARQVPRDVALVGEGLSPVSGNYHIVSILERSGVIFLENSSTTHPEQRRRQRQCGDSRLSQNKEIHSFHLGPQELAKSHEYIHQDMDSFTTHGHCLHRCWLGRSR